MSSGDEVTCGIDLANGGAALTITVLLNHSKRTFYISGRVRPSALRCTALTPRTDPPGITGQPLGCRS